jgi:hypothetical protein
MAANSSSCGVGEAPAQRYAAQFRIHQHGAVAIVPGEAQQARLAGAVVLQTARKLRHGGSGAARHRFENIAGGGEPRLNARACGIDGAWNHAANARNQRGMLADCHDASGGSHHVDHVSQSHARADGIPVRVECAHWNRNACPQSQFFGPLG